MADTSSFYTLTMAKVYEDQGNDKEALRILKHLISEEPERTDVISAINRIKKRTAPASEKQLARLFEEWVDLLLTHQRIRRLKQMNNA